MSFYPEDSTRTIEELDAIDAANALIEPVPTIDRIYRDVESIIKGGHAGALLGIMVDIADTCATDPANGDMPVAMMWLVDDLTAIRDKLENGHYAREAAAFVPAPDEVAIARTKA